MPVRNIHGHLKVVMSQMSWQPPMTLSSDMSVIMRCALKDYFSIYVGLILNDNNRSKKTLNVKQHANERE